MNNLYFGFGLDLSPLVPFSENMRIRLKKLAFFMPPSITLKKQCKSQSKRRPLTTGLSIKPRSSASPFESVRDKR